MTQVRRRAADLGQTLSRQALQDRTGLKPMMDARDSTVNSLNRAAEHKRFGRSSASGGSFGEFDSRVSGSL